MARELVIYCDESLKKGEYFSNFYGGILIESTSLAHVTHVLSESRKELGLTSELKWSAVTASVRERYSIMVDRLFDLLEAHHARIRIMFTQNQHVPILSQEQAASSYHRLYYQLVKHAFGLEHAGTPGSITSVRMMFDKMPATKEQSAVFRSCLAALTYRPEFRRAGIVFPEQQIAEIDSKKHVTLQCLDVVLGSIAFRLNERHKIKPEGARVRGSRTREKEALYKHINARIRAIYPGFNIGITTGHPNGPTDRWAHSYRHWKLVPKEHEVDVSKTKSAKRKAP